MRGRIVKQALAALAVAVLVAGCSASAKKTTDKGPTTALLGSRDVAPVARVDLATGVSVTGTLAPAVDVRISAPFPELIDQVLVKEGQAVRRGQPLARFRTQSLGPAAAGAEAARRIAAADYTRMKNLLQEGAVSQRDLDAAEAGLKNAEAAAAVARKRLQEATVRSPIDGVVAERQVQSGDRVGDGDPMFRVVNTRELEFEATIPTEAVGRVRPGAPVSLQVSGVQGPALTGHVARVNATADQATRQVKVYVVVPNRDGRLVGDLYASGRVVFQEATGALALPASAVKTGADGRSTVWVVENGRAQPRRVTTGLRDEQRDLVQITTGLQGGETAIVGPVEGLTAGQPVQVGAGARNAREES